MERLTAWDRGETTYYPKCFEEPCDGMGCKKANCNLRATVCERLAKIEDILFSEDGKEVITLDRLKELVEADNEGRVVILPCNIGDTIYRPNILNKFVEDKIEHILLKRHETIFRTEVAGNSFFEFKDKQIGNTVFLTRETAEKALEVEKDGETICSP